MAQQLRIWHLPNPPGQPFYQPVTGLVDAKRILDVLASYDLYLGDRRVSSNVQGLEVYDGERWVDWEDDMGQDIDDISMEDAVRLDAQTDALNPV